MMSWARLHFGLGAVACTLMFLAALCGWAPTEPSTAHTVPNVRENPASYRPVYIPIDRSAGGGTSGRSTGGGFGSGK